MNMQILIENHIMLTMQIVKVLLIIGRTMVLNILTLKLQTKLLQSLITDFYRGTYLSLDSIGNILQPVC